MFAVSQVSEVEPKTPDATGTAPAPKDALYTPVELAKFQKEATADAEKMLAGLQVGQLHPGPSLVSTYSSKTGGLQVIVWAPYLEFILSQWYQRKWFLWAAVGHESSL